MLAEDCSESDRNSKCVVLVISKNAMSSRYFLSFISGCFDGDVAISIGRVGLILVFEGRNDLLSTVISAAVLSLYSDFDLHQETEGTDTMESCSSCGSVADAVRNLHFVHEGESGCVLFAFCDGGLFALMLVTTRKSLSSSFHDVVSSNVWKLSEERDFFRIFGLTPFIGCSRKRYNALIDAMGSSAN